MLNIKYSSLINNYEVFLSYAFKTCDSFSLTFQCVKPYSEGYIESLEKVSIDLKIYLLRQLVEGKKFYKLIQKHRVVNIYRCCKETKRIILSMGNVFKKDLENPEDICFFRNNNIWFDSVQHEKEAVIINATSGDEKFLDENNIVYYSA